MKDYKGELVSKNFKYAIVVSRFNSFITDKLLEGAIDALLRSGTKEDEIDIYRIPGSFELPLVAQRIISQGKMKYNAIICLGAVIRGETPHFDYVAAEVSKGIANVSLKTNVPLTFGVITADNTEQAIERAGNKSGNKGFEAAKTAIELLNLFNTAQI